MDAAAPGIVSSGQRFSFGRHLALASFWFGGNYHWGVILAVLLPFQVARLVPRAEQATDLGLLLGLGSFFAMTLPPLVGLWSDHLRTPWGRRRPIMVVGTLINAAFLVGMFLAPTFPFLVAVYLGVQIFNNAAGAAFNGIVPDVVPPAEFGKQSGFLGAMVQLGYVGGLASFLALSALGLPLTTYLAIAAVLLVTLVPTVLAAAGEGMGPVAARERRPLWAAVRDFFRPLHTGDFAWVVFTRLMITAGIWTVFPFLQYFFRDVAGVPRAADFTSLWLLIVLLSATPLGLAGGWLSDRFGRKPFVYASGAAMGAVVMVFIALFPHQVPLFFVLGILYGVGYGLYYAVDWALACDTLPNPGQAAKDMGLFHVAFTLPQVLLPAVFGRLLDALNALSPNSGYRVVFSAAIAFYLLGTLLVSRVRSVR